MNEIRNGRKRHRAIMKKGEVAMDAISTSSRFQKRLHPLNNGLQGKVHKWKRIVHL